ncbi:MAG: hypothetical protein HYS60_01055 [Candidatus Wildermuthbacteria bacterium]|nr:hypothetical protein [Candidatus Wildermuthbacteria bacterium]
MNIPLKLHWDFVVVILLLLVLGGGGVFALRSSIEKSQEQLQRGRNVEEVVNVSSWQTYRNEEYEFEVGYPKEFIVREQAGTMNEDFYLLRVDFEGTNGDFVRILVQSTEVGIDLTRWSLDDFVEFWEREVIGHATDKIDQKTVITVNGDAGVKLAYQGSEGSKSLVVMARERYAYAILGDPTITDQILSAIRFLD